MAPNRKRRVTGEADAAFRLSGGSAAIDPTPPSYSAAAAIAGCAPRNSQIGRRVSVAR